MWSREPTTWERIVMVGLGTWFLAFCVLVVGAVLARQILVPAGAAEERGRAQRLARSRTLIGFGLVATLSIPYRAPDESLDDVWGNFNTSVLVALAVFLCLSPAFWLMVGQESRGGFQKGWKEVWARFLTFVVAGAAGWAALVLCGVDSPSQGVDQARLGLIVLAGFFGFVATGCWCISCHWFGMARAHPLFPPLVAGTTILIVTGWQLHTDGPDPLPWRFWLLVNLFAVITTFGVCLVEVLDTVSGAVYDPDTGGVRPARWPLVVAAVLVVPAMVGTLVFVTSGTAEQVLCAGSPSLVNCL